MKKRSNSRRNISRKVNVEMMDALSKRQRLAERFFFESRNKDKATVQCLFEEHDAKWQAIVKENNAKENKLVNLKKEGFEVFVINRIKERKLKLTFKKIHTRRWWEFF